MREKKRACGRMGLGTIVYFYFFLSLSHLIDFLSFLSMAHVPSFSSTHSSRDSRIGGH